MSRSRLLAGFLALAAPPGCKSDAASPCDAGACAVDASGGVGGDGGRGEGDGGAGKNDGGNGAVEAAVTCSSRLAFASQGDGFGTGSGLAIVDSDGTTTRTLTNFYVSSPSWSPDGARLAFQGDDSENMDVSTINADGTNARVLDIPASGLIADGGIPHWARSGTTVAFAWDPYKGGGELYLADDAGGEAVYLTAGVVGARFAWSPDGTKFAFTCLPQPGNNREICTINSDGSDERNLTQDPAWDGDATPFWSPDGSQIFFLSPRSGNQDLWVMEADGSDPRNLTSSPEDESDAAVFPDGSRILFVRRSGSGSDLYSMNIDGTDVRNLTNDPEEDASPVISPDGARIAWSAFRKDRFELYTANADGTAPILMTPSDAYDIDIYPRIAAWAPCTR